jgi:hypothetical protein
MAWLSWGREISESGFVGGENSGFFYTVINSAGKKFLISNGRPSDWQKYA